MSQARSRGARVVSSIDEDDKPRASSDLSATEETADLEPRAMEAWTRVQFYLSRTEAPEETAQKLRT